MAAGSVVAVARALEALGEGTPMWGAGPGPVGVRSGG